MTLKEQVALFLKLKLITQKSQPFVVKIKISAETDVNKSLDSSLIRQEKVNKYPWKYHLLGNLL